MEKKKESTSDHTWKQRGGNLKGAGAFTLSLLGAEETYEKGHPALRRRKMRRSFGTLWRATNKRCRGLQREGSDRKKKP